MPHFTRCAKSQITTQNTLLDAQVIFTYEKKMHGKKHANASTMMLFLVNKKRQKKTLHIKFNIIFNNY